MRPGIRRSTLLERILQFAAGRHLALYPAQEEAVLELLDGRTSS
jgi:hypothetical protein